MVDRDQTHHFTRPTIGLVLLILESRQNKTTLFSGAYRYKQESLKPVYPLEVFIVWVQTLDFLFYLDGKNKDTSETA